MTECFILLVAAHCFGDFFFQSNWIVRHKKQWPVLALHGAVHGLLAYLFLQQWTLWPLFAAVFLAHALIDRVKSYLPATPQAFALDQAAHFLSLWVIAALITYGSNVPVSEEAVFGREWIVLGGGFVATVWGIDHFVTTIAAQLCRENPGLETELSKGLKNGGALIGRLERALIFLFVLIGQPAGIGFLVAAKSILILRFEEPKKQPLAEYVFIGTLWSFALAIAIAALIAIVFRFDLETIPI